jgi:hypothetical protein
MKTKEPKFMQELHRIRAKLSREWAKMSDAEFLAHMHSVGREFRSSLRSHKNISASSLH